MFKPASKNQNDISSEFLEENFKNIFVTSNGFTFSPKDRPSASSSMCQRQVALNMKANAHFIQQPPTLNTYAQIGNTIEKIALAKYKEARQLIVSQWKLPTRLTNRGVDVGGIIDAIVNINDQVVLIDIKTIGVVDSEPYLPLDHSEISALLQGSEVTIQPNDNRIKNTVEKGAKESHFSQLQIYAAITGLDTVFIQLLSRRVQDKYSFTDGAPSVRFVSVPTDDAVLEKRIAVVIFGNECAKRNILPDKLYGIKKTHCADAFCPFQKLCWDGEHIPHSLEPVDDDTLKAIKKESIQKAREYISDRPNRLDITMELLKVKK